MRFGASVRGVGIMAVDDGDDDLASSPHVARGLARERLRAMASRMRPRDVARAVEAVEEDDSTWARFIAGRGDVATRGSAMRARAALHDAHARALDSMTASTSRETYRTLEEDAEDYARALRRDVVATRDACLAEIPDARARERDEETTDATRAVSTSTTSRAKKRPKTNGTTFRGGNRELKDLLTTTTTAPPPPTTTSETPNGTIETVGGAYGDGRKLWYVNALHRRFNIALSAVLGELVKHEDVEPFLVAVDVKNVPDYYKVIDRPIDIATMRAKLAKGEYLSKDGFLEDLRLMEANAVAYNGSKSVISKMARAVVGRGEELLSHMPRVDFVTCVRAAEYAETLTNERDRCVSEVDDGEDDTDGEEDPETKLWREATLARRVRDVFRAKALAGVPIGSRRACRPRNAWDMRRFMISSEDHVVDVDEARAEEPPRRRPEDDGLVANAVPTMPTYSGSATLTHPGNRNDELLRCIATLIVRPSVAAVDPAARSMTNVAAKEFLSVVDVFAARATVAVSRALTTRRLAREPVTDDVSAEIRARARVADDARVAARALKEFTSTLGGVFASRQRPQ